MSVSPLLVCSRCGKVTSDPPDRAGSPGGCPECGESPPAVPAPPGPATAARSRSWTLPICSALLLLGALAFVGEFWYLHRRQEARAAAWATQVAAAKMETARVHMARREWSAALRVLQEALDTEKAGNHDEARALLLEARRGEADALLEAAGAAVAHKDVSGARRFLRDYLDHPQAADLERARQMQDDIAYATSDQEAEQVLAGLSDADLERFARQGILAPTSRSLSPDVGAIFRDTLGRYLPGELRKREDRRAAERAEAARRAAELARQEERLRQTPTFREFARFVLATRTAYRQQKQLADRQQQAMAQLFVQLGVGDADEQQRIRTGLQDGAEPGRVLEEAVVRQRVAVKQAYRRSPEFAEADAAVFDRLVDQELDALLKEKKPS
jgi:hypothetical protein